MRSAPERSADLEPRKLHRELAAPLTRLLTRRFGPLPAWGTARIAAAPITQLDAWLDGILDAPSLTDLIGVAGIDAAH